MQFMHFYVSGVSWIFNLLKFYVWNIALRCNWARNIGLNGQEYRPLPVAQCLYSMMYRTSYAPFLARVDIIIIHHQESPSHVEQDESIKVV
jgi:hypothetical protein